MTLSGVGDLSQGHDEVVSRADSPLIFSDRLRRGFIVFGAAMVVLATVATALWVHSPRAYEIAWPLTAGLFTTPGIVLSYRASRISVGDDRHFWVYWLGGLLVAYALGIMVLVEGITGSDVLRRYPIGLGLIGIITVVWSVAIGGLVQDKSGNRAITIDILDLLIGIVTVEAPLLFVVIPGLARAKDPWFSLPSVIAAVAMAAVAGGSAMLVARLPADDRRNEWLGLTAAVVGSANSWLQVGQGITGFRLAGAPVIAVHALSMALLMLLPVNARRKIPAGLDRLSPQAQVRGSSGIPILVGIGVPATIVEAVTLRFTHPWIVPLCLGALGALVLLATTRHVFTVAETRRLHQQLERVAGERGLLLANLVRAVEDDRHRMAAQLHDLAVGSLATLGSMMQASYGSLPPETAKELVRAVDGVRADVAARAESLRRLMTAIQPPVLEEESLTTAISAALSALYGDRPAPALEVHIDPDLDLDWTTKTIVYRIAQEALGSVFRRGTAHSVVVDLSVPDGRHLTVSVSDDGSWAGDADEGPGGVGELEETSRATMRLFAELGRGVVEVARGASGGTVITVTLGVAGYVPPPPPPSGGSAPPSLHLVRGDGEAVVVEPQDEGAGDGSPSVPISEIEGAGAGSPAEGG